MSYENPKYNVHKNVGVRYTLQNTGHTSTHGMVTLHSLCVSLH